MIEHRHAITAAVLITITCCTSVFGGVFIYLSQPEIFSPSWIVQKHFAPLSTGIVMWLVLWWSTRKFPNPHDLERPLKKYHGVCLIFACAISAYLQIITLGTGLEIFEQSPTRAKLFLAAIGIGIIVLGNSAGKLPSPYKGQPEPYNWDKMNRFGGRLSVITGLIVILYAFAFPSRMAPVLLLWCVFVMVVSLLKHHQLKQEKRTEGF